MYNLSNVCLNVAMAFATCWIVEKFYSGIFERKKIKFKTITIWIVYFVLQLLIEDNRGHATIGLTAMNIALIIIIGIITYEYAIKTLVFIVFSLCFVWTLFEMLVYFGLSFTSLPQAQANIVGTVISKILVIIVMGFISVLGKSRKDIYLSAGTYVMLMIIPIGSIYFAVTEFFQFQYSFTSLFKFALLISFNLTIFQLYFYMAEKYAVEHEKHMYEQQIEYMARNKEDNEKLMDEFYEEKHNFKNVLLSMRSKIEHDDKETVLKGIGSILDNIEQSSQRVQSCDKNVDATLNGKFSIAINKNIDVRHDVKIPRLDTIDTYDMAILLGDAMDNAIEAAEQCEELLRCIKVVMGVKKNTLIIIIENGFNGVIRIDGKGKLRSTKANPGKHGYGMRSINRIIEKYQGDVLIEHEKGIFKINMTIPLGNFDRE